LGIEIDWSIDAREMLARVKFGTGIAEIEVPVFFEQRCSTRGAPGHWQLLGSFSPAETDASTRTRTRTRTLVLAQVQNGATDAVLDAPAGEQPQPFLALLEAIEVDADATVRYSISTLPCRWRHASAGGCGAVGQWHRQPRRDRVRQRTGRRFETIDHAPAIGTETNLAGGSERPGSCDSICRCGHSKVTVTVRDYASNTFVPTIVSPGRSALVNESASENCSAGANASPSRTNRSSVRGSGSTIQSSFTP
jgi:hypothetical protein